MKKKDFSVDENGTIMFGEDKLLVQKVQGAPVLYVKKVKDFIKRELWYKMPWRKCLEITSAFQRHK